MLKSNINFYFNFSVWHLKKALRNCKCNGKFLEILQANIKTKVYVFKFWVDIKVRNRQGGKGLGRA